MAVTVSDPTGRAEFAQLAVPPLSVTALWIQRTATGTGGLNQFTLDVLFDSLA